MHHVIIWQDDPEITALLHPLLSHVIGAGVFSIGGHFFGLHHMRPEPTLKSTWYDPGKIAKVILDTAKHALQSSERLAQMQVMFMFHQSDSAAVNAIMGALTYLAPDVLDNLAKSLQKDLSVGQVVLLSCESGTDYVVPEPVPEKLKPWVTQAKNMRQACFRAFIIRKVDGSSQYAPYVITFSTGDPERGGVVLNPWAAKFVNLRGHFTENGGWEYDLDAAGHPDKTREDTSGTMFIDFPGSPTTRQEFAPGQNIPPLLPPIP